MPNAFQSRVYERSCVCQSVTVCPPRKWIKEHIAGAMTTPHNNEDWRSMRNAATSQHESINHANCCRVAAAAAAVNDRSIDGVARRLRRPFILHRVEFWRPSPLSTWSVLAGLPGLPQQSYHRPWSCPDMSPPRRQRVINYSSITLQCDACFRYRLVTADSLIPPFMCWPIFFTARRYASAVYVVLMPVRLSVCLSVTSRINMAIRRITNTTPYDSQPND